MDSDIPHCKAFGNLTPAELLGPQHPKSAVTHNKTGDLLLSMDIHNHAEQSDPFILAILDMLCVKTNSKVTHTHTHTHTHIYQTGELKSFKRHSNFSMSSLGGHIPHLCEDSQNSSHPAIPSKVGHMNPETAPY
jgi:hypothetical protein